ncbi:hypothetical protein A1O7_00024 [Cladophialophora yegresii CBS 114405]|uniref:Zn(2)-C6 fungal-type domain-containing protein n=1 Tax=Cladophialophora yegresii CBS 114405 TaxID=1182544 RepID=W9WZL4_9EURO|nr:uncharacterized protein A1O7_00024 [Cladophialophora yegresii CBS 114405]EXJ63689.1 hypothetical protein A1O7_00024 [Cladophialophora yegresii CBS 114405]
MSSDRHVDADHPLKGRMAYLPALLSPPATLQSHWEPPGSEEPPSDATQAVPPSPLVGSKRKRPRAARACEFCRAKKHRCDELLPCSRCKKRNRPCIYKDAELARGRFHALARRELDGTQASSTNSPLDTLDEGLNHNRTSHDHANEEVSEINPHTMNTEFHGPTSSLAFLAAVQHHAHKDGAKTNEQPQSLISAFHNESFTPQAAQPRSPEVQSPSSVRYHFRQSRFFLDGYFQNLHFIHPVISRESFYSKCEDLWFDRSDSPPPSFVALYYAIMSLGAIIQEWDEETLDGMGRFDWARKMFHLASGALELTLGHNDLETVQACLIMAKVCQNELNPHLAYLYLGRAVRTALSAGFNRRPRLTPTAARPEAHSDIARTWWGLYSLEIEMSFALGRPDSLGLDIYHNQTMPAVNETEHAILAAMVDFARLVRKVSVSIYASAQSTSERLAIAAEIESEMDAWLESVPSFIRPNFHGDESSTMIKEPKWAKKQKHTLRFRYLNVKMVLYRPFLLHAAATDSLPDPILQTAVKKCVSSARATIQLMHQMYCELPYFRTWWYNVTYTLYGASIILCYLSRLACDDEKQELQKHIDLSISVLDAMEDHVVARKAGAVLREALTPLLCNWQMRLLKRTGHVL